MIELAEGEKCYRNFPVGSCDDATSDICPQSVLNGGHCGDECPDCGGEVFFCQGKYVCCDCKKEQFNK